MKRTRRTQLTGIVVLTLLLVSIGASAVEWEINWVFDTPGPMPEGWYAMQVEGRVMPQIAVEETSGRPALRIRPQIITMEGAYTIFPVVTDRLIVEFSAYTPGDGISLAASASIQQDIGGPIYRRYGAYIAVRYNQLMYYVASQGGWDNHVLAPVDTTKWNRYKIDIDVPSKTYTVYLNDMETPVGTVPFRNDVVDRINMVHFSTWDPDNTETMWVNDIRIYVP